MQQPTRELDVAFKKGQTWAILPYCVKCSRKTKLRRCRGCRYFIYCSRECQAQDWSIHRSECSEQNWLTDYLFDHSFRLIALFSLLEALFIDYLLEVKIFYRQLDLEHDLVLVRVAPEKELARSLLYLIRGERTIFAYKVPRPDQNLKKIELKFDSPRFFLASLNLEKRVIILKIEDDFHYLYLKEAPTTISVIPDYRPARNPYSRMELKILTSLLAEIESGSKFKMKNPRLY